MTNETKTQIQRQLDEECADDVSWPELIHNHGNLDECCLVALCTALGADYDKETIRFEKEHGVSLGEAACKPALYHFRMKDFLEKMWGKPVELFFHRQIRATKLTYEDNPDLSGVGVMTCRGRESGDRHAVAYQDGWVYDGNAPGPLRYKKWATEVGPDVVIDGMSKRKEQNE